MPQWLTHLSTGVSPVPSSTSLLHSIMSYVVQQVCLFMYDPSEPNLVLIKHILRYIKGSLSTVFT